MCISSKTVCLSDVEEILILVIVERRELERRLS
jgi:hypothetical protein